MNIIIDKNLRLFCNSSIFYLFLLDVNFLLIVLQIIVTLDVLIYEIYKTITDLPQSRFTAGHLWLIQYSVSLWTLYFSIKSGF